MKSRRTHQRPGSRLWPQTALDRIEACLERETKYSNNDLIRRMRAVAFADVDALEQSGTVKLPE